MFPMFANAPNPIVPLMFSGSTYPTSTPALLSPRFDPPHGFCDPTLQNNRMAHTPGRFCISPSMFAMRNGTRQLRLLDPGWSPSGGHAERKSRTRTGPPFLSAADGGSGCRSSEQASMRHRSWVLILALLAPVSCTGTAPPRGATLEREVQVGFASYYDSRFHGSRTASGERYDEKALTAAHRTLPFGTRVQVTNLS